jgi:hypothetical protein
MTPMDYVAAYADHIDALARLFGVKSALHPDDHLLAHMLGNPGFADKKDAFTFYFEDGATRRNKLESIKKELVLRDGYTLLEFASGYGRITRHLINSSTDFCACDIHPAAVDFLRRDIGARAFISSPFPEMFQAPQQFDAVFALSFFTHMPIATWARWLVRLVQATRPGGFVIFTTHGLKTPRRDGYIIPSTGIGFEPLSEQRDLPNEQYGSTITTPAFVQAVVDSIHGVKLIKFEEAANWHQDQYVLQVSEIGGARPIKKRSKLQSYKDGVKAIGYIVLPYNKKRRENRKKLLAGLR